LAGELIWGWEDVVQASYQRIRVQIRFGCQSSLDGCEKKEQRKMVIACYYEYLIGRSEIASYECFALLSHVDVCINPDDPGYWSSCRQQRVNTDADSALGKDRGSASQPDNAA
jgi:hypothetical protein